MSATQISFSAFAATLAALDCAPSVTDAAIAVVARPLAVGGGECSPLKVFAPTRGVSATDLRGDYWGFGDISPDWNGIGLDAPAWLPSGGTQVFDVGTGSFIDGYADPRF